MAVTSTAPIDKGSLFPGSKPCLGLKPLTGVRERLYTRADNILSSCMSLFFAAYLVKFVTFFLHGLRLSSELDLSKLIVLIPQAHPST